MYAVVVSFQIIPARIDGFLPLMLENARLSLADEPGCERFDVCTDPARPYEVFLYELYQDRAAFDLHLQSDHFKSFDEKVAGMIEEKTVSTFAKVVS